MIKRWFSKVTEGAMLQAAVVLIVPVTCSMALAACSDLAGEAAVVFQDVGQAVNVQRGAVTLGQALHADAFRV